MAVNFTKRQKKTYFAEMFKHNQLYDDLEILSYNSREQYGKLIILVPGFLLPIFFIVGVTMTIGGLNIGKNDLIIVGVIFWAIAILFSSVFIPLMLNTRYIQLFNGMVFSHNKPLYPFNREIYLAEEIKSVKIQKKPCGATPFSNYNSNVQEQYYYEIELCINDMKKPINLIYFQNIEKAEELKNLLENYINKIKSQNKAKNLLNFMEQNKDNI